MGEVGVVKIVKVVVIAGVVVRLVVLALVVMVSLAGGIMPAFILVLMQTNRLRAGKRH